MIQNKATSVRIYIKELSGNQQEIITKIIESGKK
jgi:hypothetical protein